MKKVYVLPPGETWCVDRMAREFFDGNTDMCVPSPMMADTIWLMADWAFFGLAKAGLLDGKRVLTTCHHFVPSKFGKNEALEFAVRDKYTHMYHVFNTHTLEQVQSIQEQLGLEKKPIVQLPYWANQTIWTKIDDKKSLREKFDIPQDAFVCGSFQRDTEGSSIASGEFIAKLEKGPDLFCQHVIALAASTHIHVLLAGWRRQYVIRRLQQAGIKFTYVELPKIDVINELYNCCDLYIVAARFEGGPQALLETALCEVPTISRNVGIAHDVLPECSVNDDLLLTTPSIPTIPDEWKIPTGFAPYRNLLQSL